MVKQNHGDCIKHVSVKGYKRKVCILDGQNEDEIVNFAKELLEVKRAR